MLLLLQTLSFFTAGVIGKPIAETTNTYTEQQSAQEQSLSNFRNPWEMSGQFQGDIKLDDGLRGRNARRRGLWPNGVVPVLIHYDQFSESEIALIVSVMKTLEGILSPRGFTDKCQIKFVKVSRKGNYADYVEVFKGPDFQCWSFIGVNGGVQPLSLGRGCFDSGTITHEFLHALGLAHQQSAHNRDQYVKIYLNNVEKNQTHNFERKSYESFTDFGLGYDYDSIMHYSSYAFSRRDAQGRLVGPTMVALNPERLIERKYELSKKDKLKLELMYCKEGTKVLPNGTVRRSYNANRKRTLQTNG